MGKRCGGCRFGLNPPAVRYERLSMATSGFRYDLGFVGRRCCVSLGEGSLMVRFQVLVAVFLVVALGGGDATVPIIGANRTQRERTVTP
jgi:hypothetical protein